ncbi:MAG: hypothetical protein R3D26_19525 [Cyanobacteriota/Melainabacteria group bacterium]
MKRFGQITGEKPVYDKSGLSATETGTAKFADKGKTSVQGSFTGFFRNNSLYQGHQVNRTEKMKTDES